MLFLQKEYGEILNNTKLKKTLKFSRVLLGMERERQRKRKKPDEEKWMEVGRKMDGCEKN